MDLEFFLIALFIKCHQLCVHVASFNLTLIWFKNSWLCHYFLWQYWHHARWNEGYRDLINRWHEKIAQHTAGMARSSSSALFKMWMSYSVWPFLNSENIATGHFISCVPPFAFRAALFLCTIPLRCWSIFRWLNHTVASDFSAPHSGCKSPLHFASNISQRLYWIEIWWVWRPFRYNKFIVMFRKPVWDDLSFVTQSVPRKYLPHITPSPAWTVDTKQNKSMLSMCSSQILTLSSQCYSTNCLPLSCMFSSNIQQRIFSHFLLFLFFAPFSVNPRDNCVGKSQ